jgi:hypothetical protein
LRDDIKKNGFNYCEAEPEGSSRNLIEKDTRLQALDERLQRRERYEALEVERKRKEAEDLDFKAMVAKFKIPSSLGVAAGVGFGSAAKRNLT